MFTGNPAAGVLPDETPPEEWTAAAVAGPGASAVIVTAAADPGQDHGFVSHHHGATTVLDGTLRPTANPR